LGGPEGRLRLTGVDNSYGYNLGFLIKPHNQIKLGITYRSRVDLDFNGGDVKFNLGPVTSTKASGTHVPLPPIISAGINWQINPQWSVEFVHDYTRWSEFRHLKATFASPLLGGLISGFLIPQNWKDTSTLRLGTAYKLTETFELRGGMILDETPVPSRTLGPAIPSADLLTLNGGISYNWRNFTAGVSYMPVFYKTRRVNNNVLETGGDPNAIPFPAVPGPDKYKTFQNFVSFNLGYRF
jgi:long-chain fatty acid transport protein